MPVGTQVSLQGHMTDCALAKANTHAERGNIEEVARAQEALVLAYSTEVSTSRRTHSRCIMLSAQAMEQNWF